MDDIETNVEVKTGENKADDGATEETKSESPSDVRGETSDPVKAPGPALGGDQPDGTNENQDATTEEPDGDGE